MVNLQLQKKGMLRVKMLLRDENYLLLKAVIVFAKPAETKLRINSAHFVRRSSIFEFSSSLQADKT
jgi:hypothetical protein